MKDDSNMSRDDDDDNSRLSPMSYFTGGILALLLGIVAILSPGYRLGGALLLAGGLAGVGIGLYGLRGPDGRSRFGGEDAERQPWEPRSITVRLTAGGLAGGAALLYIGIDSRVTYLTVAGGLSLVIGIAAAISWWRGPRS